ncbi:MAG: TGS domain-containing protein, partial [Halobacteriota archaeon]
GPSARHAGQRVGLDHQLLDEDTVTLVASRK